MDYRYSSTRPVDNSSQYSRRNEPLGYSSYSAPYYPTSSYHTVDPTNPTRRQLFTSTPRADAPSGLRGGISRSAYKNPVPSYNNIGKNDIYLSQTQRPLRSGKPNNSRETTRLSDSRTATSTNARDTRRTSFSDSHRSFARNQDRRNDLNPSQHQFTSSTYNRPKGYTTSTSTSNASRRAQPPQQNTRTYEREPQKFIASNQPPPQRRNTSTPYTTQRKRTGPKSSTKQTDRIGRSAKYNTSGRPMSSQPAARKQAMYANRHTDLVPTTDQRETTTAKNQIPPTHRRVPETKPPRASSTTRPPRASSGGSKKTAWGSANTTAKQVQSSRKGAAAAAAGAASGKAKQASPHPERDKGWKNSAPNTRDMSPMDALKAICDCELFASVSQVWAGRLIASFDQNTMQPHAH